MSDVPNTDVTRLFDTHDTTVLSCPLCSASLDISTLRCRQCGVVGQIRRGILSFSDGALDEPTPIPSRQSVDLGGLHRSDLDVLASLVERQSIRGAVSNFLDDPETGFDPRPQLFDVSRDSWLSLVSNHVRGRCLHVNAGMGRRSMLLAELADDVYATDRSLSSLRIATARDDFDTHTEILPIHTDGERLPFADGVFDTIVADLTGLTTGQVQRQLARVESLLDQSGSLLVTVDRWPRRYRVTDRLGIDARDHCPLPDEATNERSIARSLLSELSTSARGGRSVAHQLGIDHVETYALFPSATRPLYAFDVDAKPALDKLIDFLCDDRSSPKRLVELGVGIGHWTRLLQRSYPSALHVFSNETIDRRFDFDAPLVISGRSRSVVLECARDSVTSVWKLPNRRGHSFQTTHENAMLSRLQQYEESFTAALPEGESVPTRFGTGRREAVAPGRPLSTELGNDPDSFERVLRIGFDWLIDFQQACRSDPHRRSPAAVRSDLRFEPTGLEPPAIDTPVTTFETPVHGDYIAKNVRIEDESVSAVIDWEYGDLAASPVIDAGFFLLDAAACALGSFEAGVEAVCHGEDVFADHAHHYVREYCEVVGLPTRTFWIYLPSVFIHRLRRDWNIDATSTYTSRMQDRSNAVQLLLDELESTDFD